VRGIVRWCLKNRAVVFLTTLILLVSGAYATTQLNQELLPEIEFPTVIVSTPVPGAGPDSVDEQVTQPVEAAVEGIGGIEGVRSTSSQGFSVVVVEFGLDVDTEEAEAEVAAAVDGVALPQAAGEPEVQRLSFAEFPVSAVSLSAEDGDLQALTEYAREEAIPRLEEVEGVGSVDLVGGSEGRIAVDLDPERLREEGVSADAVVGAVSGANVNAPSGSVLVDGRNTPVRATNGEVTVESLRELPVGASAPAGAPPSGAAAGAPPQGAVPGGAPPAGVAGGIPSGGEAPDPVLLRDVADVREASADISGISRANGEPSLSLNIVKEPDANTVEVAEGVREVLNGVRADLGEERVFVVFDSAEDVEASVASLVEKALLGGALAIVIIFVFLRSLRATLVTAVSLPTSILAALLFSWAEDLTLNIITLAGLTIAVGRVVDDAIVVLENSYRYVQEGYDPEEAALRGTTEVASAVTSSTLVPVAVFLPLGLVGGIVSRFFLPLSLTVASALLASLLVSITIIPVLASVLIKRRAGREGRTATSPAGEPEASGPLSRLYVPALRWSLRHRVAVLLLALLVFAGGLATVPFLGVSFFPQSEERLIAADVELPPGTAAGSTAEELEPFEEFLSEDRGVEGYQLSVGGENSADPNAPLRGENQTQAFVALTEEADVERTLARIRSEGERLYGEDFQAQVQANGPPSGGLEVTLTGDDEDALRRAAERVVDEVERNGSVANVESDLSEVGPEILAELDDRRAAEAGLRSSQVPSTLGVLLGGGRSFEVGEQTVAVGVSEGAADSLEEVRNLPVGPDTALSEVAEVREVEAPAAVTRVDGERAVTVTGDITTQDTGAVSAEVSEAVAGLDLPDGVTATVGGESEDIQESFQNLLLSIAVALALVFLVLVVFFGSVATPLVILLSVPLITAGSFGALLLTGTPLSVPALLGVLLLIGIVVANAILLVDFARNALARHESVDEAIVEAGRERLRPILMTALATVFALLPLALGIGFVEGGANAFISSSLAIPVIGGLVTSTFLTLFVVPVAYSLLKRGFRRSPRTPEPPDDNPPAGEESGFGPDTAAPATVPAKVPAAAGNGIPKDGIVPNGLALSNGIVGGSGDELLYELGLARGRAEVLERELERRDRELADARQRRDGGLASLLRRRR